MTRTSDGKEIDVPAEYRVIAAADEAFERQKLANHVQQWKSQLDLGPDETFGQWVAATDTQPALLKSVAFVPKEAPNVVLYLLGLGVHSEEGAPVKVSDASHFEIQGQIDIETTIFFGIQVAYANGDYAGKFRTECRVSRDASGHFIASADLRDFELDPSVAAYKDKLAPSPDGLFVNGVWSFTHSPQPSGLRITEIKLDLADQN